MIIKVAGLLDSGLKLFGKATTGAGSHAFTSLLKNPVVKNTLIGAGTGAIGGLATGEKDHKFRSMFLGAGIGAAGGMGSAVVGVKDPSKLFNKVKTNWNAFSSSLTNLPTP